jgi:hypothetical protein
LQKAASPFAHGVANNPEFRGDLGVGLTVGAAEHDTGALRQPIARRSAFGPPQQLDPILGRDNQWAVMGAAAWHDEYLSVRPDGNPSIMSRISVTEH